jgi:alkaline phosphatase D
MDGELVYCQDDLGFVLGDDDAELESWWDPAGLHIGCRSCWADVLTHGPIQGAPRSDGADIWIRTDVTRSARVELHHAPSNSSWIADWNYGLPEADFTQVLHAEGLEADTEYTYTIHLEGGETAGPFSYKTAPIEGEPGVFDVAFGSCSKFDAQPVFDTLQENQPDLFLFAGDNHYGNTADRDSLRWFYQRAHGLEYRKEFMAETPILATWDDHDFTGNNTDGHAEGKEEALEAFMHYWPNPSAGTADTPGTFFSSRLGDVEIFMLDDRYYRGLDDSMLGEGQRAWLKQALLDSTASFKLLVSGSQWTSYGSTDSWKSFLEARDSLFSFIWENEINGVVLLSGDIHRSSFRLIEVEGGAYALPELTSSPLSNTTTACKSDEELVACYNSRPSYIQLAIDTDREDPLLRASLRTDSGDEQHSWEIFLSELSTP